VDAVYISLPNHLHAEWGIRCAEAGKHVLCEKPLTTNAAEAEALFAAVRERSIFFMEAFMYRCSPQTARLAQLLREGVIGEVRLIQANFSYRLGPQYDNIRLRNDVAGGGIMDVGCYTMSMARLVAGAAQGKDFAEPEEIQGSAHIGPGRVDEWAVAALKFPGDILANLACGSQVAVDSTLRIWGAEGNIAVPNPWFPGRKRGDTSTIRVQRAGAAKEPEEITVEAGIGLYENQVDILARHREEKQAPPPCMTWEDSLGNMRALDRWRQEVGLVFDREKDPPPA
jgi:predicted dehydrogenase